MELFELGVLGPRGYMMYGTWALGLAAAVGVMHGLGVFGRFGIRRVSFEFA